MQTISILEIQLGMAIGLFVVGALSLLIGIFFLVSRSGGKEVRALTNQTAQLAKKGLAEEVAGLVGNASSLLSATNELVRTATGIGVFLSLLGFILMVGACWLVLRIN
jgi:hypothetical protein